MTQAHPTDDQLRRAFEGLAAKHRWAEPFEVAMQHPLRSRLVRAMAVGMAARRVRLATERAQQGPKPARSGVFPTLPVPAPSPARQFDPKRAAAGDRD